MSRYRIEHRSENETRVVATTSDVHARQEELSHLAVRLIREGATGELVLVDETTGDDVARRLLIDIDDDPAGDAAPDTP